MTAKKSKKQSYELKLELKGFLSFLILHELNNKDLSGMELAEKIGKRKNSTLTPGTIYPALKKLRLSKYISYKKKGREKTYKLTEKGKQQLNKLYSDFSSYFYGLKKHIKRSSAFK